MWVNKDGLPFGAKAMASWIKKLFVNLATMTTLNKELTE
jgi:hypothetical protein